MKKIVGFSWNLCYSRINLDLNSHNLVFCWVLSPTTSLQNAEVKSIQGVEDTLSKLDPVCLVTNLTQLYMTLINFRNVWRELLLYQFRLTHDSITVIDLLLVERLGIVHDSETSDS